MAFRGKRHPKEYSSSSGSFKGPVSSEYYNYKFERSSPLLRVYYVGRQESVPGDYWQRSNYEGFNVTLVTAGNHILIQGGKRYIVHKDEIFLLHKGRPHHMETGPAGFSHRRFLEIDGPILDSILRHSGLSDIDHIVPGDPAPIYHLMKSTYRELQDKKEGFAMRLSALAFQILQECANHISPHGYPEKVETAISFMERNLTRSVAIQEIASHVGMSVPNFHVLFKKHLQQTPLQFFIQQKMEWASHLLLTTPDSVKTIALKLGYSEPQYFSNQFHKHVNVSPSRYRQERTGRQL